MRLREKFAQQSPLRVGAGKKSWEDSVGLCINPRIGNALISADPGGWLQGQA
jgi:hypothetical protein